MKRTYAGLTVLGIALFGNDALARPKLYTLVELVEQAPLIIAGRVISKKSDLSNVVVEELVKGESARRDIQFRDIPRRVPVTPGLRLVSGDQVMLFLDAQGEFFTSDHQSKLDMSGCDRLAELVILYLDAARTSSTPSSAASTGLRKAIADYQAMAETERIFVLEVVARGTAQIPVVTIAQILGWGLTDTAPGVRWEAFVAVRRLDLVLEKKSEFLAGLRDSDRRVRAVSFDALREKAGKTFDYDPSLSPAQQSNALADWDSWGERK